MALHVTFNDSWVVESYLQHIVCGQAIYNCTNRFQSLLHILQVGIWWSKSNSSEHRSTPIPQLVFDIVMPSTDIFLYIYRGGNTPVSGFPHTRRLHVQVGHAHKVWRSLNARTRSLECLLMIFLYRTCQTATGPCDDWQCRYMTVFFLHKYCYKGMILGISADSE